MAVRAAAAEEKPRLATGAPHFYRGSDDDPAIKR
jgi:hypothetical protein